MTTTNAFFPQQPTVKISVGATSSNALVFQPGAGTPGTGYQVRFYNSGSNITYVAFGNDSTVTATTSSLPLAGNSIEVFAVPFNTAYVAAIGTSGNTLFITAGEGL